MNAGKPSPPKAPQMRHIQKSWSRPDPANNLVRPTVGKVTQQREGKLVRTSPSFDIGKKIWAWSNRKGDWLPEPDEPRRWADIYVLCLEKETDPGSYNPLDLSQWKAFVIPTSRLDEEFPDQKTVSVSRLLQEGFQPVGFDRLGHKIERVRQLVTASSAKS